MNSKEAKVIVYTGEGKGKTTAALGYALATAAQGKKATVVQFLKGGGYTGELFAQKFLSPLLTIRQFGYGCQIAEAIKSGEARCRKCGQCFRENRNPEHGYADKAFTYAAEVLAAGEIDVLVLDEVSHAIRHGLLALDKVIHLLAGRPPQVTIILTGRHMPDAISALADRVTVLSAVKHPMHSGIDARRGSEY
jgi:cob(I)alamin adenosyltransferase